MSVPATFAGAVVVLSVSTASFVSAQTPAPTPTPVTRTVPASKDELAAITARGKLLAEYDQAAWHASDAAAQMLKGETKGLYVADKVKGKWVVSFGRLSDERDRFLVVVEATQKGKTDFKATKFDTPKEETGRVLTLARAVSTCIAEFKGASRPYNVAVLPALRTGPRTRAGLHRCPGVRDASVAG